MQFFVDSITELTTAATDGLLAVQAVACMVNVHFANPHNRRSILWQYLFASLALGSLLGAIAHGVVMSKAVNDLLWHPIYFFLGLTLTILALIAIQNWWGEPVARRLLPWMLSLPFLVVVVTWLGQGEFVYFVIFEAMAMLFVLVVYGLLVRRGQPGAGWVLAGIIISLIAALVQASGPFTFRVVWSFDHNGLFHLLQMPGVLCFYISARNQVRVTEDKDNKLL